MMLVDFLTSSTDALQSYSVGDFFLITLIFSLKRLHFLPYHLFHYHIHPEQAQDQPTNQSSEISFYKIITRKLLFDTLSSLKLANL
jgi:hypothetical protein